LKGVEKIEMTDFDFDNDFERKLFEDGKSVQQKFHFETPEAMKEFIETFEFPKNSYILVKGSRAMQMEQFLSVLERRYRND